jgi:hypothetical protein
MPAPRAGRHRAGPAGRASQHAGAARAVARAGRTWPGQDRVRDHYPGTAELVAGYPRKGGVRTTAAGPSWRAMLVRALVGGLARGSRTSQVSASRRPRNRAKATLDPTATGGAVFRRTESMFSYRRGAARSRGSTAKAATSALGRAMSVQVLMSTGIRRPDPRPPRIGGSSNGRIDVGRAARTRQACLRNEVIA